MEFVWQDAPVWSWPVTKPPASPVHLPPYLPATRLMVHVKSLALFIHSHQLRDPIKSFELSAVMMNMFDDHWDNMGEGIVW